MIEVPLHGFAHAGLERFCRSPAEFAFCLAGIDRIATIMTGAVGDKRNELAVRTFPRREFIQQSAQRVNHIDVGFFIPATDVVGLAGTTGFEHTPQGAAMIANVQPVTNLTAIAINRQRFACERIGNDQRDELLGELQRSVIIRAIARYNGQAVGVMPGTHQMVGRGFRCRVRTVRRVGRGFGKRCIVRTQTAEHLVSGYVQKAKCGTPRISQASQIGTRRLQQAEGAVDISTNEIAGAVNRAIDMTFSGEMNDGAWPVLVEQRADECAVADIALHEDMPRVAGQRRKIGGVARISQLVQIEHRLITARQPIQHEVRADEAGTASHQNHEIPLKCDKNAELICSRILRY